MRAYHDTLNYLRTLFESDEFVNTVTSDGFIDFDNFRRNIYPLVDIYIMTSPLIQTSTSISQFTVDITVVDIRDFSNEDVNDKFYHNDNRHDNWNLTHSILKTAFAKVVKNYRDENIHLESSTDAERIVFGKENGLDGWRTTWTISVEDNTSIC